MHRIGRSRLAVRLVSGLLTATLAACGAGSSTTPPPPQVLNIASVGPLGNYLPITNAESNTLMSAARAIVGPCLERAGVGLAPAPPPPPNAVYYFDYEVPRVWGSTDIAAARENGLPIRALGTAFFDPPQVFGPAQTTQQAAFNAAMDVQGSTGCWAPVVRELGSPNDGGASLVLDLIRQAEDETRIDGTGARLLNAWTACMAAAGYANQVLAENQPPFDLSAPPLAAEKAYATASARCDAHNGTSAALVRITFSYERQLAQKNSTQLWAAYEAGQRRVTAATRVLASAGRAA